MATTTTRTASAAAVGCVVVAVANAALATHAATDAIECKHVGTKQ